MARQSKSRSGETVAQANRRARQENHRAWLSEKCTLQHLVDNLEKIEGLDTADEFFDKNLAKYKVANEQRIKLLAKTLPDIKSVEFVDEDGNDALPKSIVINVVSPDSNT